MTNKKIFYYIRTVLVIVLALLFASLFGSVVSNAESDLGTEQEIVATYYINETGEGSDYISKDDCTLVGEGTISFDQSLEKFCVRNNSAEVMEHLVSEPDCSGILQEGEEVKWVTIYRSHMNYYVIGEKVSTEDTSDEESEPATEDPEAKEAGTEETGTEETETEETETEETETEETEALDENLNEASEVDTDLKSSILTEEKDSELEDSSAEDKSADVEEKLEEAKKKLLEDESLDVDEFDLEALDLEGLDIEGLDEDSLLEGLTARLMATTSKKTFSTYADMIASKIAEGTKVTTKGYYKSGDGGGCSYVVSKTKGSVWVRLPNNLFANVVTQDVMTPQQFGAVADGTTDDSEAFTKMAKAGVSTIKLPAGTYNFNSTLVKFNNHLSIVGVSKTDSILKDVCITAPYGLSVKDVTCDGGGYRDVWTPGIKHSTRAMFVVTPEGEQTVEYSNCVFKNSGFVSLASTESGSFIKDSATDCEFRNITIAAVFHSCNTHESVYKENLFIDLGDRNVISGGISLAAIWIGDVANIYHTSADYCEINHNRFYNLYSGNDFSGASHVISSNFIAVKADKAIITRNTIKEVKGFGKDREAIYTKVTDLEITNNTIVNGGTGEGYICNKSTDGNLKCTIKGNVIQGTYGCGIRQYGTADISNNRISITHCIAAISMTARSNQTGDWPMTVSGNTITGGAGSPYKYRGHTESDYSSGSLIKIINPINKLTVSDNQLNPTSDYASYLSIANAVKDVIVDGNTVDALGRTGNGVLIYTKTSAMVNTSQSVLIRGNNVSAGAGEKAITLSFPEANSKRKIEFKNNTTNFASGSSKNYPLTISNGANNNDSLVISGNSSNCDKSVLIISVPTKNITNKDENFAKLNKKSG